MKKFLAVLSTLVLLVSLAACGTGQTADDHSEPQEMQDVTQSQEPAQPQIDEKEPLPSQPNGSEEDASEPQNSTEPERPPAQEPSAPVPTPPQDTDVPPRQTPDESAQPQSPGVPTVSPAEETETSNILIAYFTWADNTVVEDEDAAIQSALGHYESMGDIGNYDGVDAVSSASVVAPGNAAQLAAFIQQEVGGELHSITAADPYPSNYEDCLDRAADEKAEDARPALSSRMSNMEDYDIVFLGFPNWWYTLPMPVLTFVEEYDWTGKTVAPFVTHGTGGLSATVRDLTAALPENVTVLDPIGVYRPDVPRAQAEIREWIAGLDLEV